MFRAEAAKAVANCSFTSSVTASSTQSTTFASFANNAASALILVQLLALPAFADDAPGAGPSPIMQFVPIIVMVVVMYFLMICPQSNRAKTHQQFVTNLKRGDEVVTASGILGRIEGLTEQFVTLEIAPSVRIKILRSQIASTANAATSAPAAKEVNT